MPAGLERAAAYAWRGLIIGLAAAAALWLVGRLLVVVVPVAVAVLLARALTLPASRLRGVGLPAGLAAAVTLLGFLALLFALLGGVGVAVAGELDALGPTLRAGVDDATTWLVDDSPFDVERADIDRWREQAGDSLSSFVGSGAGSLVSSATIAAEVVVGTVLALIVTFFVLKDGRRMVDAAIGALPPARHDAARRAGDRAWKSVGAYLRGAALLGLVESLAIGLALLLVGSNLVGPVMLVTFLTAFVPLVGAVVAGVIAVLVALATAGTVPALIVAGVALLVQQLDNDLLAPMIYGRELQLHPLVVILGIATGGALFGLVGTVFAVPVLAVVLNVFDEVRTSGTGQRAGAVSPVGPAEPD